MSRNGRSLFDSFTSTPPELAAGLILAILGVIAGFVWLIAYPFVTSVGPGEIVIEDCGGDRTVWRYPRDEGLHWDGFCRVTTYPTIAEVDVKERMPSADVDVTLRATVIADMPTDDGEMKALHEAYGSSDAFLEKEVMSGVMADIRAAVADPAWHEPKGNIVERKLKGALEYGIRRVSPTGAIWSSHEAKRALTEDIRRRVAERTYPHGVRVGVTLGFVTER